MAALDNAPVDPAADRAGYQYWAFISYSHADAAWARWLHAALESYRIPARLVGRDGPAGVIPKKLFPVFRDRDELAGSSDLGPELEKALRRSRFQIVIASPNAARSRWVNEEIKYFKSLGRSAQVLGLIVDGEPHATAKGEPARECFPEALRFQVGADGNVGAQPAEPIAADARKSGDGRPNALLKLIAGVIGVGFDELRQRELQARNRRLAALASVATAVSAVTLVLAVVAYQARNDALRRQQQAEDLLQFMLGDLREKLEPIGKLAILDAVGTKAMDYFATLDQSDLTDTALASRATALRQIGSVRIKQGDMAEAQAAYREALKLDEELVLRHPRDTAYLRNMAESVYSVGYGHYVKGEMELARPWLERYAALSGQLVMLEPGKPEWAGLAVEAQQNLGALAFARKDLAAAETAFKAAITTQIELVDGAPDNRAFIETLAALHGWLWSIESDRRAWPEALAQATRQAELQRRLLDLAPDHANYRYGLASAGVRMLRNEAQMRPLAPDSPVLRETLRGTEELVALDPDNVEFANLRIVAFNFLVEAYLAVDKFNAAEAAAQQALRLARQTYGRASANVQALRGLLLLLSQTAKLGLLRHDRAAARASIREALALPEPAQFDAIQAMLRLDLDLTDWGMAVGTAEAGAIRGRVAESIKRVEAAGAMIKPELMLRYTALQGDLKQVGEWYPKLTNSERHHPFLREFCRVTAACAGAAG